MGQIYRLSRLKKILSEVRKYDPDMAGLTDEQLAGKTVEFKERLKKGETLDQLLPEAFAAVCEADWRVLGKKPYDVQVLGGIALHEGFLAEMNTGEGKTLTATMPLYLNALTGKSTILVTSNPYLVIRDAEEMGQVYRFMGLTVGVVERNEGEPQFTHDEKREIYRSDIVYATHSTIGFDYLFNNLVNSPEERFMREFNYIIIDEADSVLLDAATTPLVVAGYPRVQSNLYKMADFFVTTLVEDRDYCIEEKNIWLTDEGIDRAQQYFDVDNLYSQENFELNKHITLALKARYIMENGKDYIMSRSGELYILDGATGRVLPGVKIRGGLHQAMEVKEGVEISQETRSMAAITYQNLFRLFPRMGGMSGTISDAETELFKVYHKMMVIIPPNHPMQRVDLPDKYYRDAETQFMEAAADAIKAHKKGQPVLIIGGTIKDTEIISQILMSEKIPHNVLNANNMAWEAQIIKEAGRKGAVTVATSIAGRGTDIKLGDGVKELGGLKVIGIGRLENTRLERQARGRAGRQGDPGESCFHVCLQDEIVVRNCQKLEEKYSDDKKRLSRRKLKKIVNGAQQFEVELSEQNRRRATEYDQVMQAQRKLIYATRNGLLDGGTIDENRLVEIAGENVNRFLGRNKKFNHSQLVRYILDNISYRLDDDIPDRVEDPEQNEEFRKYVLGRVKTGLKEQKEKLGSQELMDAFMRKAALKAIDEAWIEQVDYLQQLQSAVTGRNSAQRNPLYEYELEARRSFDKMENTIRTNILRNILLSNVYLDENGRIQMLLP